MKDLLADFEAAVLAMDTAAQERVRARAQARGPAYEQLVIGLELLNAGDLSAARRCFETALEQDATEGLLHRLIAGTYLASGDPERAERHVRSAVTIDDDAEAWRELALILCSVERWEEAITALETVIGKGDPDGSGALTLARIQLRRNRVVEAFEALALALPRHSNPETVYELVWDWARQMGAPTGALALRNVTRSGTHDADTITLMDVMALHLTTVPQSPLEDRAEAEDLASSLLERCDEIPTNVRVFITSLLHDRGLEQPTRRFLRTLADAPVEDADAAAVHLLTGADLETQGKVEEALESYRSSVTSAAHPEDTLDARLRALRLLLVLDDDRRIRSEYVAFLEGLPPWLDRAYDPLLALEAVCLHRLGDPSGARALLHRIRDEALRDEVLIDLGGADA